MQHGQHGFEGRREPAYLFALETHAEEIATPIRKFLTRYVPIWVSSGSEGRLASLV